MPHAGGAVEAFASLPAGVLILLMHALGGWNLIAAPDNDSWRTLSTTFLTRGVYDRFNRERGWRHPEVNELAALFLGTHRASDVEGTCLTYGVPGMSLPARDDASVRHEAAGTEIPGSESTRLAEQLQYAAILDCRGPVAGPPEDYIRQVLAMTGSDIRVVDRPRTTDEIG